MSNHRISIDSPAAGSFPKDFGGTNLTGDSESMMNVSDYIQAIVGGAQRGKIRFNYGASQAVGTITFSSFVDSNTVTINSVVLTGKTTPSGASQWAVGASDEACANNLMAKINASALDLIVGCVGATRRATVLLSSFANGDTVTINGHIFTGKTTPDVSMRNQFAIGVTDAITASNLKDSVNRSLNAVMANVVATVSSATVALNSTSSLTVTSSADSTVTSTIVVITSLIPGQIGNLCSLAISANGSVSGALLTGGTEGTEVIFSKNYTAV